MLRVVFSILGFLPFFLFAQGFASKQGTVYLDESLKGTTKKHAVLQGTVVPSGDSYLVQVYYDNGKVMFAGTYADKKLQQLQGLSRYYHDNGVLQAKGMMDNNQKAGTWLYWYDNKQLRDSGRYVGGYLEGNWKSWHPNGAIKSILNFKPLYLTSVHAQEGTSKKVTGSQLDGPCQFYYDNGSQEGIGTYDVGRNIGKWEWFWKSGAPSTTEYYNMVGKLDSMRCYDSMGNYQGEFCSIDKPASLIGYGDLFQYVNSHFRWPDSLAQVKRITSVKVSFKVNTQGKMELLRVESTERILAETVHRFIKSLPDWYPAISHNRPINWSAELKIPYIPLNKRAYVEEPPVWNGPPVDYRSQGAEF